MLQEGGVDPRDHAREVLRLLRPVLPRPRGPGRAARRRSASATVATTATGGLSGGERQRLALALALVGRPELLVLDEPTAGMDPAAKQATRERIAGLRAAGTTILLTTHELGDVERLADRVAMLDRGRIVAAGTPAELTGAGAPRVRFRLSASLGRRGARPRRAAAAPGAGRGSVVDAGPARHYELHGPRRARPTRRSSPRSPPGARSTGC